MAITIEKFDNLEWKIRKGKDIHKMPAWLWNTIKSQLKGSFPFYFFFNFKNKPLWNWVVQIFEVMSVKQIPFQNRLFWKSHIYLK